MLFSTEWLAMGTLATFFGGIGYAMSGSPKAKTGTTRGCKDSVRKSLTDMTEQLKNELPPIEASDSEEESFILYDLTAFS